MRFVAFIPRLLLIVAAGALLITATVVGVAPRVWSTANSHEELPVELPEFEALAQRTYIYDANGQEIGFYELENSQPIAFADIPPVVIDAFLTVEDKEFFNHDGINVRSLVRATLSNFASEAPQQGASTITMQVVKNDFLAGLERDGRYKLLQIHYARMLEKEKTKEEILARYLNTVFFGNNAYGIAAAAETYFGKTTRRAHLHRGRLPRRPREISVGLRSDQRTRTQPGPVAPGRRPAGGGRQGHAARSHRTRTTSCCPRV